MTVSSLFFFRSREGWLQQTRWSGGRVTSSRRRSHHSHGHQCRASSESRLHLEPLHLHTLSRNYLTPTLNKCADSKIQKPTTNKTNPDDGFVTKGDGPTMDVPSWDHITTIHNNSISFGQWIRSNATNGVVVMGTVRVSN